VGAIRIGPDKVNGFVNKQRVNLPGFLCLRQGLLNVSEHPFNESVLDHEGATCLHCCSPYLFVISLRELPGLNRLSLLLLPEGAAW
jgi:hypothetical protein